jgi:hypothetical protein
LICRHGNSPITGNADLGDAECRFEVSITAAVQGDGIADETPASQAMAFLLGS